MKKTVAIITAICLVISMGSILVFANTSGYFDRQALRQMSEAYDEMIKEYADYEPESRLIIYTNKNLPSLNCLARCDGYKDLHILQFGSKDEAVDARMVYRAEGENQIESVRHDLKLVASNISPVGIVDSLEYEDYLSDYTNELGIDEYISNIQNASSLPEVNVSIIGSGIYKEHDYFQGKDRLVDSGLNLSSSGEVGDDTDDYGLGTLCTGIVADNTTNNVKITNYKCLNENNEAYASALILAIYNAIENEADMIMGVLKGNSSTSAGTSIGPAIQRAIDDATAEGILFCTTPKLDSTNYRNFIAASVQMASLGYKRSIDGDTKTYYESYYGDYDYTNKDNKSAKYVLSPNHSTCLYKDNKYAQVLDYKIDEIGSSYIAACAALTMSVYPDYSVSEVMDYLLKNGRDIKYCHTLKTDVPVLSLKNAKPLTYFKVPNAPVFSVASGTYDDEITLELTTDEEEAKIYYNIYNYDNHGSFQYRYQANKYTKPLKITRHSYVYARAFYKKNLDGYNSDVISNPAYESYLIYHSSDEGMFEIDEYGFITKYNGTSEEVIVPDEVDGRTVEGIGDSAFAISRANSVYDTIRYVYLPSTCTNIASYAFCNRKHLETIEASNITYIGRQAFYNTGVKNIDLTNLENTDRCAIMGTMIEEVTNYNLRSIWASTFSENSKLKSIKLPLAYEILYGAFSKNPVLKNVYLPKVQLIENGNAFIDSPHITSLFAPNMRTTASLPEYNANLKLFFTDKLESITYSYASGESVNVIAPAGSYAETWATENGHNFIDSNSYIECTGVYENGDIYSYEFKWKKLDEIESMADENERYFTVNGESVPAVKAAVRGDNIYYTLNVDSNKYEGDIDVRMVITLDGMEFKSQTVRSSQAVDTSEAFIEPDNGCEHIWKAQYFSKGIVTLKCEECEETYKVRFSKKANKRFAPLDLNNDKIVNGKDYGILKREYDFDPETDA